MLIFLTWVIFLPVEARSSFFMKPHIDHSDAAHAGHLYAHDMNVYSSWAADLCPSHRL